MSDKTPTPPRLWRSLGLGAAMGLAAAPAAALTPAAPRTAAADPLLWQVQAESGEQGEAGESVEAGEAEEAGEAGEAEATGATASGEAGEAGESGEGGEAGEGGEGGEGGAMAADAPELAILTGLLLVEGHLRSGQDAAGADDAEGAALHNSHPGEEVLGGLAPLLEERGLPGLSEELEALEHAARDGGDAQGAFDAALARIAEIREALGAGPADRLAAIQGALKAAAEEYGEGVAEGEVTNLEEYQDARGFVAAARAEAEALAASDDAAAAEAGQAVLAALAETDAAFPGVAPEGGLPADGAQILHGAAARAELAGLSVR